MNSAALLPLAVAAAPLSAALLPTAFANARPAGTGRAISGLMGAALLLAAAAATVLAVAGGPIRGTFAAVGPFGLTIYFDVVTAVMLLLVSFLGAAVALFSRNYLAGDPDQGRFFKWLSITVGCVLLLVAAGNLALFALAWIATSLSLHKLLTFYPERTAARLAARKKAYISRLGDICIVAAIVMAWRHFGTLDYDALFAAASGGKVAGLPSTAFLLVAGAMLKSAQFPFHGWLPDTMETPTPVSALMHAGIINAGGFLVIRFSPLVTLSPAALDLLAVVGAVTALFGSLVMITQTSVKRALAYSTIAQMGFMMLQCGLGAFALALLHIVAHSLYKAHAFLSSGSVIAQARSKGASPAKRYLGIPGMAAAFGIALGLTVAGALLAGQTPWKDPASFGLALILTIALAQLLWNWWSVNGTAGGIFTGIAVGCGLSLLAFALHLGAKTLVGSAVVAAPESNVIWPLAIAAPLAFLLVGARVFLPPSWVTTPFGRAVFVHAYNGFYLSTLAHRILGGFRKSL
jgi:NAD(P)H-quinone oxidoreductase subunit 5